jgi:membrane-associated protein
MLAQILAVAAGWPVPLVLAAAAVVLFAESGLVAGLALPGTTLMVALGVWAHVAGGVLAPAVVVAALATVAGAHHGWWRGRRRADRPVRRFAGRVESWFADRGSVARSALLGCGHWAAAARPIVPRLAGRAGMPYAVAGPVLAVSGAAWAATLVLLGDQVGAHVLDVAGVAPVAALAVLVGALLVRSWRSRRVSTATFRTDSVLEVAVLTQPVGAAAAA